MARRYPYADAPMDEDRFQPTSVTVQRRDGVEITFADGYAARLRLGDLRNACPCAACRNAREQGLTPYRGPAERLEVTALATAGAWALQLTWQDGHATGLYPWERLRTWAETGVFDLPADSGLGAGDADPAAGTRPAPDPAPGPATPADDGSSDPGMSFR